MRNTYTLLDYGSFVEDTSDDTGDPFIQLLPITNVAKAHQDFVNVRLSGVDTTGSASQALLPTSEMQHSPESEEEKKKKCVDVTRAVPLWIWITHMASPLQIRRNDPQSMAVHLCGMPGLRAARRGLHPL